MFFSDFSTFEFWDLLTSGLCDIWTFGLLDLAFDAELLDFWTFGFLEFGTFWLSDFGVWEKSHM